MENYAIIPTYNRLYELNRLTQRLMNDGIAVIIIDNGSTPPVADHLDVSGTFIVLRDETKPPTLYHFWNNALNFIEDECNSQGVKEWNVGIFNDDAIVPPGWWQTVEQWLRGNTYPTKPIIACTHPYADIQAPIHHVTPNEQLGNRMCPWAFMLRGETGMRADEKFGWWWGDTDFEWKATLLGGVLIVPGPRVINEHADSTTHGELMEQAGRDGEYFRAKWGRKPW